MSKWVIYKAIHGSIKHKGWSLIIRVSTLVSLDFLNVAKLSPVPASAKVEIAL